MEISDSGPPDPPRRHAEDPPAHLPRGQLLRRRLSPARPGARSSRTATRIPMTQTATPVQLDEVLTSLQSNARDDLQTVLAELRQRAHLKPTPQLDATQDPEVQGKTAAEALNDDFNYAAEAFQGVADGQPGAARHRAARPLQADRRPAARHRGASARNEEQLKDLITNFNRTMAAFASRSRATSRRRSALLPADAAGAPTRAFDALNRAFPPTRAFARELIPGVARDARHDRRRAARGSRQVRKLVSPSELGGLVNELRPTTADLANVANATLKLLPQVDLVDRCVTDVVLPTGDIKIDGRPVHHRARELQGVLVHDGRARRRGPELRRQRAVRPLPGRRRRDRRSPPATSTLTGDQLFGNALAAPLGTRPAYPGKRPPYKPDAPCYKQTLPDLNGPAAQVGPPARPSAPARQPARPDRAARPTCRHRVTLDTSREASLAAEPTAQPARSSARRHPTGGANKPTIEAAGHAGDERQGRAADAGNPAQARRR